MKKENQNNFQKEFTVIGTNANGILSKKDSLFQIINHLKPSVICLQETKLKRKGILKIQDYEILKISA